MPQKKNPDTLELTLGGVAGDAIGEATGTLSLLKGLPRAYNRDLQRAHAGVFEIADDVREATEVAAGAVATADWDEVTLADAAGEGFSTATGVADLLAMSGMPFRTAHGSSRPPPRPSRTTTRRPPRPQKLTRPLER